MDAQILPAKIVTPNEMESFDFAQLLEMHPRCFKLYVYLLSLWRLTGSESVSLFAEELQLGQGLQDLRTVLSALQDLWENGWLQIRVGDTVVNPRELKATVGQIFRPPTENRPKMIVHRIELVKVKLPTCIPNAMAAKYGQRLKANIEKYEQQLAQKQKEYDRWLRLNRGLPADNVREDEQKSLQAHAEPDPELDSEGLPSSDAAPALSAPGSPPPILKQTAGYTITEFPKGLNTILTPQSTGFWGKLTDSPANPDFTETDMPQSIWTADPWIGCLWGLS